MLSQKNVEEITHFAGEFGVDLSQVRVEEGRSYALVMASFMAQLFRGTGMLFVEPRLLREKAVDFFQREIEGAGEINALLCQTKAALLAAGGRAPLRVEPGETNLFYNDDRGFRRKIIQERDGFKAGDQLFSKQKLIETIAHQPEHFSTSAPARPIIQSKLIPTLAYVAGPSEVDYHRQLKDYFSWHATAMPQIMPRLSMTFVTTECDRYLDFIDLQPWQDIPERWGSIEGKDIFSGDAKENKLALKECLAKQNIPYNALHRLNNVLRPHGQLQERSLNWCWLQSQTEENLVLKILEQLGDDISGDHYCYLGKNYD